MGEKQDMRDMKADVTNEAGRAQEGNLGFERSEIKNMF